MTNAKTSKAPRAAMPSTNPAPRMPTPQKAVLINQTPGARDEEILRQAAAQATAPELAAARLIATAERGGPSPMFWTCPR